jgi:hypothetical protein
LLSPDQKAQVLRIDAAAHKKHLESLSPEQNGQIKSKMQLHTKNNMSWFPQRRKQDSWKLGLNNIMNI